MKKIAITLAAIAKEMHAIAVIADKIMAATAVATTL